ncbi:hypothetical protein [Cupriavidus agavae]|uniref:Uncharacterized protein n=1 Tax=Cupriavidus agavae TaxID=1001822 RepID=A0A4Q7SB52_9BURK|nr:hypothetical protein [Cupriavidus agavae]RZT42918.1 hypothetical protein EV147_1964 [Cupriavidus agavae]
MARKLRNNVSTPGTRRCPSRLFDRAPLTQRPAQAARTVRQHIGWVFHH